MSFVVHFIRFSAVQKFWKSVQIWQSYGVFKGGNFFETQCTNNNKMRKSNFLRVSHDSLLRRLIKQWNVCLNVWQKLQSPKNEICNNVSIKFGIKTTIQWNSCSEHCPLSRTCVLNLGRHWSTALSTTLCCSSALTEMRRCTENHVFSVLLAHWNNVHKFMFYNVYFGKI